MISAYRELADKTEQALTNLDNLAELIGLYNDQVPHPEFIKAQKRLERAAASVEKAHLRLYNLAKRERKG